jgi:hypothetical protein
MTGPDYDANISDMYIEMDTEWYDTLKQINQDAQANPTQSIGAVGFDFGYHELSPRLIREGWQQIEPSYPIIGKRIGAFRVIIASHTTSTDIAMGNPQWVVIIEGESPINPSNPNNQTAEPFKSVAWAAYSSLGEALDAVDAGSYPKSLIQYENTFQNPDRDVVIRDNLFYERMGYHSQEYNKNQHAGMLKMEVEYWLPQV